MVPVDDRVIWCSREEREIHPKAGGTPTRGALIEGWVLLCVPGNSQGLPFSSDPIRDFRVAAHPPEPI